METIYIYNGASRISVPVTDSAERSHSLQQHNYVKLVWKSAENTPISANAYIEYEGQVFYCLDDYFPTHKDGIYEYDIEFHAIEDTFNRPLFFRYVDILDQTTGETTSWKEIEWSLNGNLKTIADIVITCLNRAYNNAYFELPTDSYTDTLLMSYSFSGNSIADALSTIAEQNETEWWLETTTEYVDGKRKYILHFDKCEIGITIELNDHYTEDANGVWQSGGLKSVSQSGNTNIIPQKLYVYGSERNIIKKTVEEQVEGGVMNVSYDKKLRLPKLFPSGITGANGAIYEDKTLGLTITLNEDSSLSIGGINNHFEQVKIFDEVYPKMDMTIIKDGVSVQNPNSENPIYWLKADRLKSITTENPVDGSINPGKLGLLIEGCTLMCTFTSGLLNGREFECAWRESSAEIGLIPIEENDVQIPSGVFKPQEGDTFILWNLAMPQSSIEIAQNELCVEAINYIEELATSITDTDCTTEAEATRMSGLNTKIKVGQRISVDSKVFRNGRLSSRIIKFSYKLTKPYEVSFTLASSRQTGRLATLENMISDVTHEVHATGQVQRAISRRQWHDTEEMMQMLDSIQKQLVVVGDKNNAFVTSCNVEYSRRTRRLSVTKGYLQHQSYTDNAWKGAWLIDKYVEIDINELDEEGTTPFYVYFVCSKAEGVGYVDVGSALPQYNDYYVFVLGILSSEFEGERIFNQSSGLTTIAGGTITTDVIQDPARRLIIDYSNATITARNGAIIKGAIQFEKGEGENDLGTAIEDLLSGVQGAQQGVKDANDAIDKEEQERINAIAGVVGNISNLQAQVDGEVNSWFMEGTPANNYRPADEWTNDTLKERHLGDTYTNILPSEADFAGRASNGNLLWVEQGGLFIGSSYFGQTFEEQRRNANYYCRTKTILTLPDIDYYKTITVTPQNVPDGHTFMFMAVIYDENKQYKANTSWAATEVKIPPYGITYGNAEKACYFSLLFIIKEDATNNYVTIDTNNIVSIGCDIKFTNPEAGKSWRWCNYDDEDNTTFHWHPIADSDAVKALAEAGKAQATADGKSTTFVVQPTNYDKGDLWILQSDTDHSEGKKGDILTANEASVTYVASHWSKQVKYTDDTLVNSIKYGSLNLIGRVSMKAQNTSYFTNTVATEKLFGEEVRQVTKVAAGTPPIVVLYPINDKIKAGVPYVASVYIKNSSDVASNDQYFARIIFRNVSRGSNITDVQVTKKCNNWSLIYTTYTFDEQDLDDDIGIYVYTNTGATGTTYASCLKLQEGNRPTEGFEATTNDIAEVETKAKEVSTALTETQNTLANSLEDGYIDKDEQVRLKEVLSALDGEFNELTKEYEDVVNNQYLIDNSDLQEAYDALNTAHTNYKNIINTLLGISVTTYKVKISNFSYKDNLECKVTAYYQALPTLVNALAQAQSAIQAQLDKNAQEYANNIQVGGVNLVPFNDIMLWNGTQIRNRPTITITANSSYQGGIYLFDDNVKLNTDYVLSFKLKKVSGNILYLGGYLGTATIEMYVDGVLKTGTFGNGISFPNNTNEHSVVIKFKQSAAAGEGKLFIQPNRAHFQYAYSCVFSDIQLEQGTKATSYKPNDADRIEARENLLKDVMVFDRPIASNNTTYTRIYTSEALKPNTEYVFSIESIVLKTGSATPTDISIMFWTSGANNAPINISYSAKKMSAVVTTPSHVNEKTQFFLYAGKHQATKGVGYIAFGVKLAEGNVYTGWEATPSEQQALIAVSKAMDGTTDIIGGLMLTNLIGMRNTNNQIKAGISGLAENNNLRFWAGSTAWENANVAPFRVYENGEVYAGNFFGFNGAFEINSSNFKQVCEYSNDAYIWATIKYDLTGANIYLGDLTAIKEELGNSMICFVFPSKANYVGSTITYFNPFGYAIGSGNDVLPYSICNTNNFMNTLSPETSLSGVGSINKGITDANGNYYRWSLVFSSVPYQIPTAWCQMIAMPIKVVSGTQIPSEFKEFIISGTYSGSLVSPYLTATTDCVILRWMFKYLNYK